MKRPPPLEPTALPGTEPNSMSARAARARRGINKGRIVGRDFLHDDHPDFDDETWSELIEILDKEGIPEDQQGGLLGRTQFALYELMSARQHSGPDENEAIKTFIKALRDFSTALSAVTSNDHMKNAFDDALRQMIVSLFGVWKTKLLMSENIPRHLQRELMSLLEAAPVGAILNIFVTGIGDFMTPMATTLADTARIRNAAEYKFVSDVASAWFEITNKFPTMSRNTQKTSSPSDSSFERAQPLKPPSPTRFQKYIDAAVPTPAIYHETVRGAVDELKVRKGKKTTNTEAK
jgi:hypothetical protein